MSALPGRNEPCHCGSGSKYKKCCLEKDDTARVAAAATKAAAEAASPAPVAEQRSARPVQQAPKPQEAARRIPASARRRSV